MRNLLISSLVVALLLTPAIVDAGGGRCGRGSTVVQCAPPSSSSAYSNGNGRSILADFALLDALCARRHDDGDDEASEVLTTLLPIILQILQNPPVPPAPAAQPNILLIPDGAARTSFRVTATSNQIRVPARLIPTVAKYAELKTKFAKQPSGKVVKYYELGQRKAVPISRSRYPRS